MKRLILALIFTLSVAQASVIGVLGITSGTGQLTVTSNAINFGTDTSTTPVSNAEVNGTTTLTFSTGPLPLGNAVFLKNLVFPPVLSIANFMTFAGFPNLSFTLTGEGPGSSNTNCAGLLNFQTCSPFANDPVVLLLQNGQTFASLSLNGTVTDGTLPISTWSGAITALIVSNLPDGSTPTPGHIQNYFATTPGGALTLGNAGNFTASTVPEPGSLIMIGSGLIGLAAFLRRRTAR